MPTTLFGIIKLNWKSYQTSQINYKKKYPNAIQFKSNAYNDNAVGNLLSLEE